jgi:YegS/Rv2252/BmrU family lipid kinase
MLAVIVNLSAGGGRTGSALPKVHARLGELGLAHHVEPTRNLEHARELASAAAATGELTVAFGGDGLVAAVAGAVADVGGTLGVLPGGRGNDFARALGIPLDPEAACAVLRDGETRRIDLGDAGGRVFVGIASCGFDSDVNRIANATRRIRGNLVYTYGALRALAGWKPATFTVRVDGGQPRTFSGYTVAAANSGIYGGGMRLAPEASLDDGELDVILIGQIPRLRFLTQLPLVFRGAHVRLNNVEVVRGRQLDVAADRPMILYADGDPLGQLPMRISIRPRAVNLMVPR